MNRFDPITLIIGFLTIIIVASTIIFGANNKEAGKNELSTPPKFTDAAKLEFEETELFLNKNTFIAQKDIVINNTGQEELKLFDLRLSCDCFRADFIDAGGEASGSSFGNLKSASVAPESSTILRLIFDRSKYDQVTSQDQFITFKSNDIANKEIKIPIYVLK